MNNTKRLKIIKDLIEANNINNQNSLLKLLNNKGIIITQATLSRDLKKLKVGRETDENGKTHYVISNQYINNSQNINIEKSIMSIEFTKNMGVIKTPPGYASMIALKIDNLNYFELLGTIAGDDTILLIIRDEINKNDFINTLRYNLQD